MAFGVNFGFQNPVAVQDSLVNQFIGNGLGVPTGQPVAPVFNPIVPLDAQLSLSLQARTLATPAEQQPAQQHHHRNGHGHAFGHPKHGGGPVSAEGMAYMQRRGNNGFR